MAAFLIAGPASAQDVPWGKGAPKKAPAKKAPAKKAPAKKAPAAKTPAKKAPAALTPEQKAAAKARLEKARAEAAKRKEAAAKARTERAAKLKAQQEAAAKARAEKAAAAKARAAAAKAAKNPAAAAKAPTAQPAKAAEAPAATTDFEGLLDHFKHKLKGHGAWIEHPEYGSVWIPNESEVGKNFTPYQTDGRWAVTESGWWAWVSDKDWGRIPYHYGRWAYTKDKSWAWVPDREYAPAWVVWRVPEPGNDHVGWAPMPPSHVWKDGKKVALDDGVLAFNYVPTRHLFKPTVAQHVVKDQRLGAELHRRSKTFEGNLGQGAKGLAPIFPATPEFAKARIPSFAIPATRLPTDAAPIKPIVLAMLKGVPLQVPGMTPPNEAGRFATPPADEPAKVAPTETTSGETGESAPERATPTHGEKKGVRATGKPKYRCWWTNTRPRIWRCGY